ncbi:hypothetical protein PR048_001306 [Dryococelus australis]|uniref:CCD97-like C-terminal domain-containing protein n=1 Tax=Dryococelus australis TaxID=614101 RepID=A0ABQ9IH00_9NEOP|nr:hypothetical protein PR048_001306 [Dryococelus australis]
MWTNLVGHQVAVGEDNPCLSQSAIGALRVDVKNRRYEALKKLVDEGQYFSDTEMRKRNPLLYERLVGRYLTEREVEDNCNEERDNINSLVNLFMAQIERNQEKCLRQRQIDDEDGAIEEVDTSDEDSDMSSSEEEQDQESDGKVDSVDDDDDDDRPIKKRRGLSSREKQLLKQEFVTSMYQNFLDGKDVDFDYRYHLPGCVEDLPMLEDLG